MVVPELYSESTTKYSLSPPGAAWELHPLTRKYVLSSTLIASPELSVSVLHYPLQVAIEDAGIVEVAEVVWGIDVVVADECSTPW
jgi:hypothetical protein